MTTKPNPIDLGALQRVVESAQDELFEVGHALRVLSTWIRNANDRADAALEKIDAAVAKLKESR